MLKLMLFSLILATCLTRQVYSAFSQSDEATYLSAFDNLIKDSYSAPLPSDLASACKNKGPAVANLPIVYATRSMTASELQTLCGVNSICVVSSGYTLTMNSNLNLAALMIDGRLVWTDQTQTAADQWICAGYIGVGLLFSFLPP
jgi:hypothetical protein